MDKIKICSDRDIYGEEKKDVTNDKYKELSKESDIKLKEAQKKSFQTIINAKNVIVY